MDGNELRDAIIYLASRIERLEDRIDVLEEVLVLAHLEDKLSG